MNYKLWKISWYNDKIFIIKIFKYINNLYNEWINKCSLENFTSFASIKGESKYLASFRIEPRYWRWTSTKNRLSMHYIYKDSWNRKWQKNRLSFYKMWIK